MAVNLLFPLLEKLGPVFGMDKGSSPEDQKKVWEADVIWLSIPRHEVSSVLKEIKLKPSQLVVDICSIKDNISEVVKETGASFLSLHPLHGPHIPLKGQKWVIVKSVKGKKAKNIVDFLKEQGISFFEAESEKEHDFMIRIVLGMPELLTIVMDSLIENYAKDYSEEKPTPEKLMKWSVPASNALFGFYLHSIYSSADWLREDLILDSGFLESGKKSFGRLNKINSEEIKRKIKEQKKVVDNFSLEDKKRIRYWIERWFVNSNTKNETKN